MRNHDQFRESINALLKEHPDWSGLDAYNYVVRNTEQVRARDSMHVQPGVVVMQEGMSGRLTPNPMDKDRTSSYGVMSRTNPTNAVVRTESGGFHRPNIER